MSSELLLESRFSGKETTHHDPVLFKEQLALACRNALSRPFTPLDNVLARVQGPGKVAGVSSRDYKKDSSLDGYMQQE